MSVNKYSQNQHLSYTIKVIKATNQTQQNPVNELSFANLRSLVCFLRTKCGCFLWYTVFYMPVYLKVPQTTATNFHGTARSENDKESRIAGKGESLLSVRMKWPAMTNDEWYLHNRSLPVVQQRRRLGCAAVLTVVYRYRIQFACVWQLFGRRSSRVAALCGVCTAWRSERGGHQELSSKLAREMRFRGRKMKTRGCKGR